MSTNWYTIRHGDVALGTIAFHNTVDLWHTGIIPEGTPPPLRLHSTLYQRCDVPEHPLVWGTVLDYNDKTFRMPVCLTCRCIVPTPVDEEGGTHVDEWPAKTLARIVP